MGVSGLVVNVTPADIDAQTTATTKVNFLNALESALKSFIEDGNITESPVWIIKELPEDFGVSRPVDDKTASERVRELLNKCEIVLHTEAESPDDEWAGKVMCDETGDNYGTSTYWIFKLSKSQFTDSNYAVVDKSGVKPTINWGFS